MRFAPAGQAQVLLSERLNSGRFRANRTHRAQDETNEQDRTRQGQTLEKPNETRSRGPRSVRPAWLHQHANLSRFDGAGADLQIVVRPFAAFHLRHQGHTDHGSARNRLDRTRRRGRHGAGAFGPRGDHARRHGGREGRRPSARHRQRLPADARFLRPLPEAHGRRDDLFRPLCRGRHRLADETQHDRRPGRGTGLAELRDAGCAGHRRGSSQARRLRDYGQHLGDAIVLPAARTRRRSRHRGRDQIPVGPFRSAARARLRQRGLVAAPPRDLRHLRHVRRTGRRLSGPARPTHHGASVEGGREAGARYGQLVRDAPRGEGGPAPRATEPSRSRDLEA